MDFSWALSALKAGLKVTRSHWKTGFLWCKPAGRVEANWCHDPVLKALAEKEGGVPATSTISCCFKDVAGVWTVTTGWVPQQFDLFADDWEEYVEPKKEPAKAVEDGIDYVRGVVHCGEDTGYMAEQLEMLADIYAEKLSQRVAQLLQDQKDTNHV